VQLRVRVPAPFGARPPLPDGVHVRVVQRGRAIEAKELAPTRAQADPDLFVLARDEARVVATDLAQRGGADHDVATEARDLADGTVPPLDVANAVEDRAVGKALPSIATDGAQLGLGIEGRHGRVDPPIDDLAVAIDELDVLDPRRDLTQALEACVAGTRCGERRGHVELDDRGAAAARLADAVIGRSGIHVDDGGPKAAHRIQRTDQALPLVPADENHSDAITRSHGPNISDRAASWKSLKTAPVRPSTTAAKRTIRPQPTERARDFSAVLLACGMRSEGSSLAPIVGDTGRRYQPTQLLARGGMAEIYVAEREDGQETVVVKRMLGDLLANPEFVRMFRDEAVLASTFDHPNIVRVLDMGLHSPMPFFVMEYVRGAHLRTLLKVAGTPGLPLAFGISVGIEVAGALAYAHDRRDATGRPLHIVHRDVSPTNVLVDTTGEVKLLDFGIAKADAGTHVTAAGTLKGKASYMSPEQCRAEHVDRRSDIFALGLLLYELTTSTRVFRGDNELAIFHQVVSGKFDPPSSRRHDYPAALEAILLRALAFAPEDRYATALDFADALVDLADRLDLPTTPRMRTAWMETHLPTRATPLPGGAGRKRHPSRPGILANRTDFPGKPAVPAEPSGSEPGEPGAEPPPTHDERAKDEPRMLAPSDEPSMLAPAKHDPASRTAPVPTKPRPRPLPPPAMPAHAGPLPQLPNVPLPDAPATEGPMPTSATPGPDWHVPSGVDLERVRDSPTPERAPRTQFMASGFTAATPPRAQATSEPLVTTSNLAPPMRWSTPGIASPPAGPHPAAPSLAAAPGHAATPSGFDASQGHVAQPPGFGASPGHAPHPGFGASPGHAPSPGFSTVQGHPAPAQGHPAPAQGHPAPAQGHPAPPPGFSTVKGHPAPPPGLSAVHGHPAPPPGLSAVHGHPAPSHGFSTIQGHPAPPPGFSTIQGHAPPGFAAAQGHAPPPGFGPPATHLSGAHLPQGGFAPAPPAPPPGFGGGPRPGATVAVDPGFSTLRAPPPHGPGAPVPAPANQAAPRRAGRPKPAPPQRRKRRRTSSWWIVLAVVVITVAGTLVGWMIVTSSHGLLH